MKGKLVSVSYRDNGTCERADVVINVDEYEYKKLKNEIANNKQLELKAKEGEQLFLNEVKSHLEKHKKYVILLAKTLYDNYVDRGYYDENELFQKAFYDYLFKGKELTYAPKEFLTILEKIEG